MKYTLPTASADELGGIRVGGDFEIDADGTLNIRGMSDMQQRVEDIIADVSAGKALIAASVTEKGVDTAAADAFSAMAEKILLIETGNGKYHGLYHSIPRNQIIAGGKYGEYTNISEFKTYDKPNM